MLFANDVDSTSHTENGLQQLVSHITHTCTEFGLAISLNKTKVMAQNADTPPNITISVEAAESFKYLGFTISNLVSTDLVMS